jgi:predicted nuclease with TOPRIM domain
VGERQKGHVYYRCHDRLFKTPPRCPRTSIREDQLDNAVLICLKAVELSDEELTLAQTTIEDYKRNMGVNRVAETNALRLQIEQTQSRMTKLTDLLIEGTIEKSLFEEKKRAILLEQTRLKENLADIERGGTDLFGDLERTVELAKSPSLLYKRASIEKKRELLKTVLSNLTVLEKNVRITLAGPFQVIEERRRISDGGPYRGTCRTWEQTLKRLWQEFYSKTAVN